MNTDGNSSRDALRDFELAKARHIAREIAEMAQSEAESKKESWLARMFFEILGGLCYFLTSLMATFGVVMIFAGFGILIEAGDQNIVITIFDRLFFVLGILGFFAISFSLCFARDVIGNRKGKRENLLADSWSHEQGLK